MLIVGPNSPKDVMNTKPTTCNALTIYKSIILSINQTS